jgi:hypothetical protein
MVTKLAYEFFSFIARKADPVPTFPEGEELGRLIQGANKHQIYLFEQV